MGGSPLMSASDLYPAGSSAQVLGISDQPTASSASGHFADAVTPKEFNAHTFILIVVLLLVFRVFYEMLPS